jgi:hypothetical protein
MQFLFVFISMMMQQENSDNNNKLATKAFAVFHHILTVTGYVIAS